MITRLILLAIALIAPVTAKADWVEASTEHFVVYANDDPAVVERFAGELETFDKVLSLTYPKALPPTKGAANRVAVFVLSGSGAMAELTGSSMTRGFYIPRAGGNVAFVPRISGQQDANDLNGATVLRHEYAHHFMYTRFFAVFPLWFSEGFAEFWSTVRINRDGTVDVGLVPQHRGWGLLNGNPLPLDQLLTLTNRKLDGEQVEAIYGRGWLLTHYLMRDPARQKQLQAYMDAINRGEPLDKAATALGDVKLLAKELNKYLRGSVTGVRIPADRLTPSKVTVRKLTPGEVATMAVRIQSKAGVSEAEAQKVVLAARKAAAAFPNDPGAQVALAEAEYDAGNFALAEAAADRAVAANPKHSEALVFRAMAKFARAEADDAKADSWAVIRRAIIAANRADPLDPRPLVLFYRSFQQAGEPATADAKAGLVQAYETAPSDLGLRMTTAAMFLYDEKRPQAREALRLVAYHPHGGKLAEQARAMIEAIDRGDPADKVMAVEIAKPAAEAK